MKQRPLFYSQILERERLNHPTSSKWTYHLKLDLKGSKISYEPGDAIAIMPSNPPSLVERLLKLMKKTGREIVIHPNEKTALSFKELLIRHANLLRITPKMLALFAQLAHLNAQDAKNERQQFVEAHDILALFEKYELPNAPLTALLSSLAPMLPRFYSVASSQKKTPSSVDLLVVTFESKRGGRVRGGLGSDFLCKEARIGVTPIPLYHHPNPRFKIPSCLNTPLLMIGPGTGVAPYRAFLQERIIQKASGTHWLFFGERNREQDFYYEPFFQSLVEKGALRLDCAFSRDQKEKVYVQHLMWKHQNEIWRWIEQGAIIYICGDARCMAKEVLATLEQIAEQKGKISKENARAYIKEMRMKQQLLLDVY